MCGCGSKGLTGGGERLGERGRACLDVGMGMGRGDLARREIEGVMGRGGCYGCEWVWVCGCVRVRMCARVRMTGKYSFLSLYS